MSPTLPAQAVMPLEMRPPQPRSWRHLGLPDSGWVVLFDLHCCQECGGDDQPECTQACSQAHHLPLHRRSACTFSQPVCTHCVEAPCARVCPVDAIQHTPQGVVVLDQDLCIDCQFCLDACPAGGLTYLDPYGDQLQERPPAGSQYSPNQPEGRLTRTVAKCTFCAGRLLTGLLPVCAEQCPLGSIYVGNLDRNTVTNGHTVQRLDRILSEREHTVVETVPGAGSRVVYLV